MVLRYAFAQGVPIFIASMFQTFPSVPLLYALGLSSQHGAATVPQLGIHLRPETFQFNCKSDIQHYYEVQVKENATSFACSTHCS
jgi:hypothetical protein